jgi:large subunit ribosomal protein L9
MKVILSQDVKGQGKKGDVVNVSDGYAKNFLLAKGLASVATATALNSLSISKEAELRHKKEEKAKAEEQAKLISKAVLQIPLKVSENGKIFGALTAQMIADELQKQGIEIDKRKIVLKEPIKLVGMHSVMVKPYPEVSAELKIEVVAL